MEVYLAHGAGSLGGGAMSSRLGSTLGLEGRFNVALGHREVGAFVRALREGLPSRPPLMDRIIARNRGSLMSTRPSPVRLEPRDLAVRLAAGAVLVDLREPRAYGAGHVAGSLNVAADSPQLGERVAWFVPPGASLVLLAATEAEVARALPALARVGLDDVAGFVVGEAALRTSGLPLSTMENLAPGEVARRRTADPRLVVLDVREPAEWEEGHIPGAVHIPMRQVPDRAAELPRDRPIALVCRGGQRSSLVGSVLLARGFRDLVNTSGGMAAWVQAGLPVVQD